MSVRRTLSVLGLLALCGCASAPSEEVDRAEQQTQATIDRLAKQNDGDSLAAAAVLASMHHGKSLQLIARATAAAPDRSDLAWLHLQICVEVEGCDWRALEQRFRTLDPKNAMAWYQSLSHAEDGGQAGDSLMALRAIASSDGAETYWTGLIARLAPKLMAAGQSRSQAIGWVAGGLTVDSIPRYSPLMKACQGERLKTDDVIEQCRAVAAILMRGDTIVTELIGTAIARNVWPPDSPQLHAALDARRVYQYRSSVYSAANHKEMDDEAYAARYLELITQSRREQDVVRAQLLDAGLNPDPPADWKPSLILSPVKSTPTDRQ